ncbi:MAG: adenylate/guanylate cyclase domain-containing protein [Candidatus Thiodiazotropha sp. (ex Monitilora ramsayi)]|nr:adenylate/guanylate cyclase domain-containing protein [Candidatus Thiodiazotropha sp. (ex Monitilora ramsayi)]
METYRAYLQSIKDRQHSLEERIHGTSTSRVIAEFVGTSALFPVLDAIRSITMYGAVEYLTEPAHYMLFIAAFIQAWYLGTSQSKSWKTVFTGSLLGFGLYAPVDILQEGMEFFYEPYHMLFGAYSLLIALLRALQTVTRGVEFLQTATTLLLNIGKLLLFPAMYIIIDQNLENLRQLDSQVWPRFMDSDTHVYFFYGAVFIGILLGFAESQRIHYAQYLRYLAQRLKQYTEWSLSKDLVNNAIDNPNSLELHRVERTILFLDIREFTAWSERADPQKVVDMLNRYYSVAESIISNHHGHKPNFTADEVMTHFVTADVAVQTALELQIRLHEILQEHNLSVGIGLHTGEVIEGMVGSEDTRKYDIIGDAVNTAKRLESSADKGQIVISENTHKALSITPDTASHKLLQVKGKTETLPVYVLSRKLDSEQHA